jgi:hypothetical protein
MFGGVGLFDDLGYESCARSKDNHLLKSQWPEISFLLFFKQLS